MRVRPHLLAAGLGLAIVAWAFLLQYVLTPDAAAPPFIFWPVVVAWLFAALLLVRSPRSGAVFTALLGVASAFGALQSHGAPLRWDNLVLAGLSLLAGAVAGWVIWRRGAEFALG